MRAKTWKKGRTASIRSAPGTRPGDQAVTWRQFAARFACVSIAPFGSPVVPPVYCSTATSPGEGAGSATAGPLRSAFQGVQRDSPAGT